MRTLQTLAAVMKEQCMVWHFEGHEETMQGVAFCGSFLQKSRSPIAITSTGLESSHQFTYSGGRVCECVCVCQIFQPPRLRAER